MLKGDSPFISVAGPLYRQHSQCDYLLMHSCLSVQNGELLDHQLDCKLHKVESKAIDTCST